MLLFHGLRVKKVVFQQTCHRGRVGRKVLYLSVCRCVSLKHALKENVDRIPNWTAVVITDTDRQEGKQQPETLTVLTLL